MARLTDKDIIDMIQYIARLKEEIQLKDRLIFRLRQRYQKFCDEGEVK